MNFSFIKKSKPVASILENGIIDAGSEEFRSLCAVHKDGTYYVATGRNFEDNYVTARNDLIKQGILPEHEQRNERYLPVDEIAKLYDRNGAEQVTDDAIASTTTASEKFIALIEQAAAAKASDFEISQRQLKTIIRAKVAGKWRNFGEPWTKDEGIEALTFAFNAADGGSGHTSLQKMAMQSFSINPQPGLPFPESVIKLRGQKGYQESGEIGQHMVFRLFYSENNHVTGSLKDLGFDQEVYDVLAEDRETRQGVVFIGGVTGDGKSTTLILTVEEIVRDCDAEIKIVTVEDPVEYVSTADCVTQIPVKSAGDSEDRKAEYRNVLMHAMRVNPDVCVVSEIRDLEAAKEVMEFAASGHKVYTTLHVGSANAILFRLIKMGMPPAELAGSDEISLLLKQSLIPLLCDNCKIPLSTPDTQAAVEKYQLECDARLYKRNDAGCKSCNINTSELGQKAWAGFQRLSAVGEFIKPNDTYLEYVFAHDQKGARQYWLKPIDQGGMGGITIKQKLAKLLSEGRIDLEDAKNSGLKPVWKMELFNA